MAGMGCTDNQYMGDDGSCCDRCKAGEYVRAQCNSAKKTECAKCEHGTFTDTQNHLTKCQTCKTCSLSNNQQPSVICAATNNTVCECVAGFYCEGLECDHCTHVTRCRVGEGVKTPATPTSNAVCAPCEKGTFSSVTDYQSPCTPHTRCKDLGRVLKTPGTHVTDAVCGDFKSNCHWILPAGLWSGLVLTALVLLLILWRAKCKSHRAARSSICVTPTAMVPIPADTPPELPSHCQETCKFPIFNSDDSPVICSIQDSLPITPLKASVSFAESSQTNGKADYCTSHFFRSYSEPQEDEYCGT